MENPYTLLFFKRKKHFFQDDYSKPQGNLRLKGIKQWLVVHAFRHKHTSAANTINSGMILLRMFCSLKPKMP